MSGPRGARSALAEQICAQLIAKARLDGVIDRLIRTPPVFVSWRTSAPNALRGLCVYGKYLRVTLGTKTHPREWIVILAHELAHWLANLGHGVRGHGPRFQWVLWRVMPKGGIWQDAIAPGKHRRQKWSGHNLRYLPD